ncbi:uncharacterized protein LOC106883984 [Octopus bimaculoides]|uniref:uncharacterized protein LOC106883984 n=1 Tax=Octopus bimaculoides TaxID=37653 RepID=UPI00071E4464|nr:uncharacterized protein LOC106883984 [Octopus bimaculoides]|eukprot:XP_014790630.1 PREDICTED: uncharacterized protein LOC106883984 [Octopus bimaculoides]
MRPVRLWITFLAVILYHVVVHCSNANLSCYACSHKYSRTRNTNSCVTHLTDDFIQKCSENQKYCQVKAVLTYGDVKSIQRGCVTSCKTICKYILFGISKKICTKCCDKYLCNDDIASHAAAMDPKLIVFLTYITAIIITTAVIQR